MARKPKPEYLEKVTKLSEKESERLLSRMGGKLSERLIKEKLRQEEAMAVQLEIEDEQLEDWRKVIQSLREKEAQKSAKKESKEKPKASPNKNTEPSSKAKASLTHKPPKTATRPAKAKQSDKKNIAE